MAVSFFIDGLCDTGCVRYGLGVPFGRPLEKGVALPLLTTSASMRSRTSISSGIERNARVSSKFLL